MKQTLLPLVPSVTDPPPVSEAPQPGMRPGSMPPSGYGNPVQAPGQQTVQPGGSMPFDRRSPDLLPAQGTPVQNPGALQGPTRQFNPGSALLPPGQGPMLPARMMPPNTPQTAFMVPGQGTAPGAQPPRRGLNGEVLGKNSPAQPPPGSFVDTGDGSPPRVMGQAGVPLPYDDDPITGGQIPHSMGLSPDEFAQNLTPQHRQTLATSVIEAGQVPGSQFGSVGARLSEIRRAQGQAMSAQNMNPRERQQALDMLKKEENGLLHSVALDPSVLVMERHRSMIASQRADQQMQEQFARAQQQYEQKRQEQQKTDMEEAQRIASNELYDPLRPTDPAKLRQRTLEIYAHNTGNATGQPGAKPPSGPQPMAIAPGDAMDYSIAPDGSVSATDDNGGVHAAMVHQGRAAIVPQSQEEIDSLPEGTPYVTWTKPNSHGIQDIKIEVKDAPKGEKEKRTATPTEDQVNIEVDKRARAIAKERAVDAERYFKEQRSVDLFNKTAAKRGVPKQPDAIIPASLSRAVNGQQKVEMTDDTAGEGLKRMVVDGKNYDPSVATDADVEQARNEYHRDTRTSPDGMAQDRMVEESRQYRRVHDGAAGSASSIALPGGATAPAARIMVNGKATWAPVPMDAKSGAALMNAGTPFVTMGPDGNPILTKAKDHPLLKQARDQKDKAGAGRKAGIGAVTNFVDGAFSIMPGTERTALAEHILQQYGY